MLIHIGLFHFVSQTNSKHRDGNLWCTVRCARHRASWLFCYIRSRYCLELSTQGYIMDNVMFDYCVEMLRDTNVYTERNDVSVASTGFWS